MDSNTHSASGPDRLVALAAELQGLAAQAGGGLADGALAERVKALRGLMDRLQWAAGARSRSDPAGSAGTLGPPGQRRRPSLWWAAPG